MLVGFPLKFGLACTGENSPYDIKGHAQDQLTYTAVDIWALSFLLQSYDLMPLDLDRNLLIPNQDKLGWLVSRNSPEFLAWNQFSTASSVANKLNTEYILQILSW
jgi:hypothetical protein